MQDKKCKRCGQVKPVTEYHKAPRNTGSGLASYCKPCVAENSRESMLRRGVEWYMKDGFISETDHFNAAIENYAKVFNCPQLLKHLIK